MRPFVIVLLAVPLACVILLAIHAYAPADAGILKVPVVATVSDCQCANGVCERRTVVKQRTVERTRPVVVVPKAPACAPVVPLPPACTPAAPLPDACAPADCAGGGGEDEQAEARRPLRKVLGKILGHERRAARRAGRHGG